MSFLSYGFGMPNRPVGRPDHRSEDRRCNTVSLGLYQSARETETRWREAMSVLLTTIVTSACDRGFTEVDFLRGDEPYKYRFVPRERRLFRLLAGSGAAGRAARTGKAAGAMATLGRGRHS